MSQPLRASLVEILRYTNNRQPGKSPVYGERMGVGEEKEGEEGEGKRKEGEEKLCKG